MSNKYRVLIFAVAVVFLVAAFPAGSIAEGKVFPDMQGHWAEKYVAALAERGGIAGMPDGNFYPDDSITFPQFVKIIICNKYGEIPPVDNNWASGYIQKAMEVGIIFPDEMGNTDAITRFEAVRIAYHTLRSIYEEEDEYDTSIVETFEDYPSCKSCRSEFDGEVGQCYVKGIITGKPGEEGPIFDGEAGLTRAEGSIIVMKMLDPALRTPVIFEQTQLQ